MFSKGQIVIQDACILFDLIDLGLIDTFFHLGIDPHTTSLVLNEIEDEWHRAKVAECVKQNILIVDEEGNMEIIQAYFEKYNSLSLEDCSVLELATRKEGIILSSDGSLRKIAERDGLQVGGMLWIIQHLMDRELISKVQAVDKLKEYSRINTRAPHNEIRKLISEIIIVR